MEDAMVIRPNDHVRGSLDAPVTLIEYGDYQCPFTARAHHEMRALHEEFDGKFCLVYRHLPLVDKHPFAEAAAEAAEAAGAQGKFWAMHDLLFEHQQSINPTTLPELAARAGLDHRQFVLDVSGHRYRDRVLSDAEDALEMGAHKTPTFFVNGERYQGDTDLASLSAVIAAAISAHEHRTGAGGTGAAAASGGAAPAGTAGRPGS